MTDSDVVSLAVQAMLITAKLSAPILLVSLSIGFGVSLLQSVTQMQDVTLAFVPKLLGVAVALAVSGHWMLAEMIGFTQQLFDALPNLLGR